MCGYDPDEEPRTYAIPHLTDLMVELDDPDGAWWVNKGMLPYVRHHANGKPYIQGVSFPEHALGTESI